MCACHSHVFSFLRTPEEAATGLPRCRAAPSVFTHSRLPCSPRLHHDLDCVGCWTKTRDVDQKKRDVEMRFYNMKSRDVSPEAFFSARVSSFLPKVDLFEGGVDPSVLAFSLS